MIRRFTNYLLARFTDWLAGWDERHPEELPVVESPEAPQ